MVILLGCFPVGIVVCAMRFVKPEKKMVCMQKLLAATRQSHTFRRWFDNLCVDTIRLGLPVRISPLQGTGGFRALSRDFSPAQCLFRPSTLRVGRAFSLSPFGCGRPATYRPPGVVLVEWKSLGWMGSGGHCPLLPIARTDVGLQTNSPKGQPKVSISF